MVIIPYLYVLRYSNRKCREDSCEVLRLPYSETNIEIGWIGFGGSLAGAVGGVVAGVLIDRFDQSLKWGMVAVRQCNVGRALACACDAILSIAESFVLVQTLLNRLRYAMLQTTALCGSNRRRSRVPTLRLPDVY